MHPIEHKEQLRWHELNSQMELIKKVISRIESNLSNCVDLQYLTAKSALEIMRKDFLIIQYEILASMNKVLSELHEIIKEGKKE